MFFAAADDTNIANLATGLNVQSAAYAANPGDCAYKAAAANSR